VSQKRKPPNAGKGRVKGVPNKTTADVRAAIALVAQNKSADLERWLDQTANGVRKRGKNGKLTQQFIVRPDPGKAAQIYLGAIEYHITELSTGSDTLKVEIVDPTRRDNPPA
jgi:hypothetical protein